jgi:hypothetical protein
LLTEVSKEAMAGALMDAENTVNIAIEQLQLLFTLDVFSPTASSPELNVLTVPHPSLYRFLRLWLLQR